MTAEDYMVLIEQGLRQYDGFWNEAEAAKVSPVRDVTHLYIEENNYAKNEE